MSGDLPRSAPSTQGVDADGIRSFVDSAAAEGIDLHSLMVLRHGQVIAEGWWAPYSAEHPNLVYSVSKTVTAAAAGFAVAEGRFELDDRMIDHFPDLVPDDADERFTRYRVRHALTMSSGHFHDTIARATAARPDDPLAGFFGVAPDAEPGDIFAYNQMTIYGVGRLVGRVSGQGLLEYLEPRLLGPLGIDEARWQRLLGFEQGYSGLHLRTESMAKLGQLMLDRGRWRGEQLLPADWVAQATSPQMRNDPAVLAPDEGDAVDPESDWQQGYGFQYWMNRKGYRADGAYCQLIVVWPDEDAVVVTTAEVTDTARVLNLLTEHIGGAMTEPGTTAADDALAAQLADLAIGPPEDTGAELSGTFPLAQQGIDGWTFAQDEPLPGIDSVGIHQTAEGWLVRLGETVLPVGRSTWEAGEWPAPDDAHEPVPFRSRGGTDAAGGWHAQLRMIQTPHTLLLDVTPDGAATLRWVWPPLQRGGPAGHALPARD